MKIISDLAAKDWAYRYDQACHLALLSTLLDSTDQQAEANAVAAVDALKKAVAAGYENVYAMRNDARLSPIRSRPEFQKVMQSAEANANANKD